jgi:hypothetical protein
MVMVGRDLEGSSHDLSRYCSIISLEGMRKTIENLSEDHQAVI